MPTDVDNCWHFNIYQHDEFHSVVREISFINSGPDQRAFDWIAVDGQMAYFLL